MRSYYNEGKGAALIFYLLGKQQGGGSIPPITPAGEWKTIVTDTASGYLTTADMQSNATIIWDYFYQKLGWNVNSVAALLGNMQGESTLNPGLIEVGGGTTSAGAGHGLVQWTPATDLYKVLDVLYGGHEDWYDGNKQLGVIYAEYQESVGEATRGIEPQWYKTTKYPCDFRQWAFNQLNYDLESLTYAFAANYLRPAVVEQPRRVEYTKQWLEYFLKG